MSKAFTIFKSNEMSSISQLSFPSSVESILKEMYITCIIYLRDADYFKESPLLPEDSEKTRLLNMNLIIRKLICFCQDILNFQIDESYFNSQKLSTEHNLVKLGKLIACIAAQCAKKEYYINLMQNMDEEDSNDMYNILLEQLSQNRGIEHENEDYNRDGDDDDNLVLLTRIENLDKENFRLQEEVKSLNIKIFEQSKTSFEHELIAKETLELIHALEKKENEKQIQERDNFHVSIQLSELKAYLEAKDCTLKLIKEEKKKNEEEYENKLHLLQMENATLKENNAKYEVLKEKMQKFSLEEMIALKNKLIQSEIIIKEQEEKLKKLRNYDVDKAILLKKIEELTIELVMDKEKFFEISKENNYYRHLIVQNENDLKNLKEENEKIKSINLPGDALCSPVKEISLNQIEEAENNRSYILELETKIKFLQNDKETLTKTKIELEEKSKRIGETLIENKQTIEKYTKKIEKYSKFKKEHRGLIMKISDLMDKLQEAKTESDHLKLNFQKEKSSIEDKCNMFNSQLSEAIFQTKELENEISYMKKEREKAEELIASNKLYIEELHRRSSSNPTSEEKLNELECALKRINQNEQLSEIKKKCIEKDEMIEILTEKIRKYEKEIWEMTQNLENFKCQTEMKDNLVKDEERLISALFHNLAFHYSLLTLQK